MACALLAGIMADPHESPDVEKLLKKDQSAHFNERHKHAIKTLLPLFEQKGWLDFETD
jgi:hypothetical protein